MGLGDKWKDAGKNIGGAFANFGKAMGKTAKVVFTNDENKIDENGDSELHNAWKETGKGFGEAGKSLGKAAAGTGKKVVGKDDEDVVETETVEQEEASEVVDK